MSLFGEYRPCVYALAIFFRVLGFFSHFLARAAPAVTMRLLPSKGVSL